MENAIKEVLGMYWPSLVIVLSIVVILRITYIIKSDRRSFTFHEEVMKLLFIAYLLVFFQLVISQDIVGGGTNLMPFREILRYDFGTDNFYRQVVGNIILFIPLGFFACKYCRIKNLGIITIVTTIISSIIEFVQHYIGRVFDIDDIILNVIGGIIGYLLYLCLNTIQKHLPKAFQKDFIYNILSAAIMVVVALYIYQLI